MAASPATATFAAELHQAAGKKATGIVVPPEVIEQLGAGKKPPLRVSLNGHEYRTTVGVMNGTSMIPVSAAVRTAAGLSAGDEVVVVATVDATPRSVEIPDDLAAAFVTHPEAKAFFDGLSNSLQRYHIDNINGAKAADTRQRRIDKSIGLFLAGKSR
ncbi:MAG: YdeI/OmpD-associated family protein [Acidimicrobiales bacterium]